MVMLNALIWLIGVPTNRKTTENSDGSVTHEVNRYWTDWYLYKLFFLGIAFGLVIAAAIIHIDW